MRPTGRTAAARREVAFMVVMWDLGDGERTRGRDGWFMPASYGICKKVEQ